MQNFRSKIFWFYALTILALGGWLAALHFEKKRQQDQFWRFGSTLHGAWNVLSSSTERHLAEIDRGSKNDPCPPNDLLLRHGETIKKMLAEFQDFKMKTLEKAIVNASPPPNWLPIFKNVLADPAARDQFFKFQQQFADSLEQFDPMENWELMFPKNSGSQAAQIISGSRDDLKAVLLQITELNRQTAACRAMSNLENQMTGNANATEGFLPVLQFDGGCVRAGETFRGEVFAAGFSKKMNSFLGYFADGKKLHVEQGMGKIKRVFATPGRHKIRTRVELKNPATGQVETVKHNFPIEICQ